MGETNNDQNKHFKYYIVGSTSQGTTWEPDRKRWLYIHASFEILDIILLCYINNLNPTRETI